MNTIYNYYCQLVKVFDYVCILPKLCEQCDIINDWFPLAQPDTILFTNRNSWKMILPGKGEATRMIAKIEGTEDINLV